MPISEVFNMDCVAYMQTLPDKFFDLAITDPPYGIDADVKNNTNKMQSTKSATKSKKYGSQLWDSETPNGLYFNELFRVSKNQIVWGANYFGLIGGMIYWHKNVTMPTYSTGEIAWISWLNKIDFVDITWHGMLQADMKNKEHRIHPTQKPVALYKWLIEKYAKAGDKIFDSHMGSQSSRIAAFNMGFDYWGCELDEEYFNDGNKRFIRETMQQSLFTPIPTKAEITQTTIF
jgi:site-specific DNA-methyltransferase (adenine-specific)